MCTCTDSKLVWNCEMMYWSLIIKVCESPPHVVQSIFSWSLKSLLTSHLQYFCEFYNGPPNLHHEHHDPMLQSDPGFHGPRVPIFTWLLFHKTFQNLLSVHNGVFQKKINRNARPWLSQQRAVELAKCELPQKCLNMVKTFEHVLFFSVKPKKSWNMTCLKPSNLTFESAVSSVSSQIVSQVSCIHTNTWCFSRYPLALRMAFFRGGVTWRNFILWARCWIWKVWFKTWELSNFNISPKKEGWLEEDVSFLWGWTVTFFGAISSTSSTIEKSVHH